MGGGIGMSFKDKIDRAYVDKDDKFIRRVAQQKPLSPAQQREYDKHAEIFKKRDHTSHTAKETSDHA